MILNNKSSKIVLFLAVAVILSVFTACTKTEETTTVDNGNTNQSAATMPNGDTTPQPADMNATNSANPADKTETDITKIPMSEADKNLPVNDKKDSSPTANRTPIASSGADDMFMFQQIRGRLATEKEFENGVMVDIKKGSITLTGEVSSAAQKRKAEDLVLEVDGVKTVRNNLKISQ